MKYRLYLAIFGILLAGGLVYGISQSNAIKGQNKPQNKAFGAFPTALDKVKAATPENKTKVKIEEIVKLNLAGEIYSDPFYGVTMEITQPIRIMSNNQGVEVFAKGWRGTKQLGFGNDGSIEIQRFQVLIDSYGDNGDLTFLVVPDANGAIEASGLEMNPITRDIEVKIEKFRFDPSANLKQELARLVSIWGQEDTNIEKGKVGNTVSAFKSVAGANSPVDGKLYKEDDANWVNTHDASSAQAAQITLQTGTVRSGWNGTEYTIARVLGLFSTGGTIGATAVIASSTISYWFTTLLADANNYGAGIVQLNGIASDASISVSDWLLIGSANSNPTEGVTRVDLTGITLNQYTPMTMSSTGRSWIARSGEAKPGTAGMTYLGMRLSGDMDNSTPAGDNEIVFAFADNADSGKHPVLDVDWSLPAADAPSVGEQFIYDE